MKPTVHILATVRKPEMLDAALLVFRTLRVGFPTANVCVWGNGLDGNSAAAVAKATADCGGAFYNLSPTAHDPWIDGLLARILEPFWICDTDMVFWEKVEHWFDARNEALFAGRYEPEFLEEWTNTIHVARLHTCLMWLNPAPLRAAMNAWMCRIPLPHRNSAEFPFIRQHFVPYMPYLNGETRTLFYDACAGLHHALVGTPFTAAQDAAFEHLHCATYADLVDAPSLADLRSVHQAVYQDPNLARGLRIAQERYYASRANRKELCLINPE